MGIIRLRTKGQGVCLYIDSIIKQQTSMWKNDKFMRTFPGERCLTLSCYGWNITFTLMLQNKRFQEMSEKTVLYVRLCIQSRCRHVHGTITYKALSIAKIVEALERGRCHRQKQEIAFDNDASIQSITTFLLLPSPFKIFILFCISPATPMIETRSYNSL
jgi:hypothetical protein